MSSFPANSVGLICPQTHRFDAPLELDGGRTLDGFELVYETYGELNSSASNAVLICHALSGDHHCAGYHRPEDKRPGWWDVCIGPGKAIDTSRFFVVCPNNLGGCQGSTGPKSINPESGKPYGPDFPIVTVRDWVRSQARLGQALGIETWAAVCGGSLGGMQALQWAIDFPDRIRHAVAIAAAPKLSAQNIAFNEVARQAILSDPEFYDGRFYDHHVVPARGLRLARMLGHITYLSDGGMQGRFGRELRESKLQFGYDADFEVESYLRYQGSSFANRFDANTYLLMTKVLDYFDPASDYGGDLVAAFRRIRAHCFVASFTSDWRFAPSRSKELVRAMLEAEVGLSYVEVESDYGHDSFLLEVPRYLEALKSYMDGVAL